MSRNRIVSVVLIAVLQTMLLGCQPMANAQNSESAATEVVARLVVKPREPVESNDELMKKIRERLPNERRLQFFREMSMGAYVLNVVAPASGEDIPKVVAELNGTGMFEYVELDRRMTVQPPRGKAQ